MTSANGWAGVPLADVLTKNENVVQLSPTAEYREVTVRLWGNGVVLRRLATGSEIAGDRRSVVAKDQFIVSRIDARNGAMGIVPPELDGAVVSNDFPTFNAIHSRLLPAFLGWLAKTPAFVDACCGASEGTTNRVRLKEDKFLQLKIPLPPLAEQRRIVAKIDHLAAKIEEVRRLQSSVDSGSTAFAASLHFVLSGTRVVRMSQLVELHEERIPVTPTQGYPQIGIRGFGGGLFKKDNLSGADTTYRYFNRLQPDMLVLSQVKGWEGAIGICPNELAGYYASPEYRTFRCNEAECHPQYLDTVVRSSWFRERLQDATHGQGARRERTRPERFLKLELHMPRIEDQRRAVQILSRFEAIQVVRRQTAAELDALLPSILDRAFKGQL